MNKKLLGILLSATVCALTTNHVWAAPPNDIWVDYRVDEDIVGNQIEIDGTTVSLNGRSEVKQQIDEVYGGRSDGGNVNNNAITIKNANLTSITGSLAYYSGSSQLSGAATNNHLIVENTTVALDIYGASSGSKSATGNIVDIKNSNVGGFVLGGLTGITSSSGEASKNIVNIENSLTKDVYGGWVKSGSDQANGNQINIRGTATVIDGFVHGGFTDNGVNENIVYISAATVNQGVYGGISGVGTSHNNTVSISDGAKINGIIYGGYSELESTSNTVYIRNAYLGSDVHGGYSNNSSSNNNKVYINDKNVIEGTVFGGKSGLTESSYNEVHITGDTTIRGIVYGSYAYAGADQAVVGNIVKVSSATVAQSVYGGWSEGSEAGSVSVDNIVSINNSKVEKDVCGGYSSNGASHNNKVYINGNSTIEGVVYGGSSAGAKSVDNEVYITGNTTIKDTIYGGYAYAGADQEVSGNIVKISSGIIESKVYGGVSYTGDSSSNEVYIIGRAQILGNIYGGATEASSAADANNNIVNISSGTIAQTVRGGYSSNGNAIGNEIYISGDAHIDNTFVIAGDASKGEALDNKIVISGTPTFGQNVQLWGGTGATVSNNTLEIRTKNVHVSSISGFDHYNFYLPASISNGDTMLTIDTNGKYSMSGSTVGIGVYGGSPNLRSGDQVVLITNDGGLSADNINYSKLQQGVSIEYEFTTALSADGKKLIVTTAGGRVSEQSKSPVETQAAAIGFVNSGADMVAGSGIQNAVAAGAGNTPEMFGAMGGGTMRHKSGSYADVRGYNLALGFAKTINNQAGKMTFGPFIEAGWGNYTTHLDSGIRSDGNTNYYGIGVLARQNNDSGMYYEGSLRAGILKSDYNSNDLLGGSGYKVRSSYDSSSAYYGIHFAIGKSMKISDKVKADVYTKLMYSHQNGDTVTMQGEGNGETYQFDGVDSVRARLGLRLSKDFGIRHTGYIGMAYEYEFAGDAKATVNGFSTPAPSIKGSSGMLELGYILQPKNNKGVAIDIGLQGWMGKKSGVNGNVNFIWKM